MGGLNIPLPVVLGGVFLCVFFITYINLQNLIDMLHSKSMGQRDEIIKYLELMFVEFDAQKLTTTLFLVSFGLGGIFFLLLWPNFIMSIIFGSVFTMLGWSVPKHVVKYL